MALRWPPGPSPQQAQSDAAGALMRLTQLAAERASALLDAVLPSCCALCGGRADDIAQAAAPACAPWRCLCAPCHRQFFGEAPPRCRICANPLDAHVRARTCGACLAQRPAFDATVVAADYALPLDELVLQLKFGGRLALAGLCAQTLHAAVLRERELALPALLCPVPLGRERLAQRGYNQALEIARPLARALRVALHPRLAARARETVAQSLVAPSARRANIAHAFAVADGALVRGRHIGIVDDVMTSGATLHELAATFKRYGAARVSNFVFARTPPHR